MKILKLSFLLLTVIAFGTTGCKQKAPSQATDSIAKDTIVAEVKTLPIDSLKYSEATSDSTIESRLCVDFPLGEDSLALGVKNFIARELAKLYIPQKSGEDKYLRKYPVYKGSVLKGQQMVNFYGKGALQFFAESQKDMIDFNEGNMEDKPHFLEDIKIRKREETPKYVLYSISDESYEGGAHGSYSFYYVNISKLTNKPVDQTVDSTRVKELQPILRKGVLWYLKECGEKTATEKNLKNFLMLPENGLIPLPAQTPWLQKDSLHFVYQQYEIACYAMGLVSFNVAYKDIEPYLTKEAKALK